VSYGRAAAAADDAAISPSGSGHSVTTADDAHERRVEGSLQRLLEFSVAVQAEEEYKHERAAQHDSPEDPCRKVYFAVRNR
jgi:hypothetical protein